MSFNGVEKKIWDVILDNDLSHGTATVEIIQHLVVINIEAPNHSLIKVELLLDDIQDSIESCDLSQFLLDEFSYAASLFDEATEIDDRTYEDAEWLSPKEMLDIVNDVRADKKFFEDFSSQVKGEL